MRLFKLLSMFVLSAPLACSSAPTPKRSSASAETGAAHFAETIDAKTFYKGNLHTHTSKSDGDDTPRVVLQWYKAHGYNFVAITDHDKYTPTPKGIETSDFITLPSVEVTGLARVKNRPRPAPVHVNAICADKDLVGIRAHRSTAQILQDNIDLVNAAGALTIVNHPNFGWALSADDLLAAEHFEMLEIASGHPLVNEHGNDTHPSHEELWDRYMTKNHRIFGVAVDDAHHYSDFAPEKANPGRAWVQAWAPELSTKALCEALAQGHFYASTGGKLQSLVVSPNAMEVTVGDWTESDYVDFIGAGGELKAHVTQNPARYELQGGEGYIRAHVVQRGKDKDKNYEAWTQAYFIKYE